MPSALEARACAIDEELMLCRLCRWQHERKFQGQDSGAPLEIAQQRVEFQGPTQDAFRVLDGEKRRKRVTAGGTRVFFGNSVISVN